MKYILIIFSLFLFLGCSSPKTPLPIYHNVNCKENVYSLKSAECLKQNELIEHLEPYKVIFIGDHHSSVKQHKHTAQIIRDLSKKGYKIHLANEWFTPKDNPLLKKYADGTLSDDEFIKKFGWKRKRNFKFELFSPLYHAIRDTKGELYGVNLSKYEQKLISNVNVKSMSSEQQVFFNTLDLDVYAHRTILAPFFGYCHKPKAGESNMECIKRMYRVQVAWDTKMGQESAILAKSVLKTDKDKLIVFIGTMHLSHNLGINLRFARESTIPFVTILPQRWNHHIAKHGEADFIYMYQREEKSKIIEEKLVKNLR